MRVLVFAACLFLAVPGMAQEPPKMTLRLFDYIAVYLPPPWSPATRDMGELVASFESLRNQGSNGKGGQLFLMEYIPKGESFDSWTQLYAITAETPLSGDLQGYVNHQFNLYHGACASVGVQTLLDQPAWKMALVFCSAYKKDPQTGEVVVISFVKPGKTLIKHYFHARGPGFDLNDRAGLPLPEAELQKIVNHLAALRLGPVD